MSSLESIPSQFPAAIAARAYGAVFTSLGTAAQANVVAYVQGQLPASDADLQTATTTGGSISLYGYVQVADVAGSTQNLTTDYGVARIGGGDPNAGVNGNLSAFQEPLGLVGTHVVRSGDTLQSVASLYYGSPSYWYVIADANGLTTPDAPLKEGVSLTIPNVVTNSYNNDATFRVYNANDILGATLPELRFKPGLLQRDVKIMLMIVAIVVEIVVTYFSAGLATSAVGLLFATLIAYAAGYGTSVATQEASVDVGLQDKVDYKQARRAGTNMAITALAAGLVSWANTARVDVVKGATTAGKAAEAAGDVKGAANAAQTIREANALFQAERAGIEVGKQLLQNHGRISNISGIVGAFFGLDTGSSVWGSELYAGMNLAETASRNKHQLNALDWTTFATSALDGYFGTVTDANKVTQGEQYFNRSGFNWTMLAREALFTGARTVAAESVANDRRYQNQDIVANTLAQGLGGIAGNILGQSPGFQRSTAAVGKSLASVEESVARGWSGLTNTVADTYNNVTALFNLNTAGESLANSALAEAQGAQGGADITAAAPWPAPVVGTPLPPMARNAPMTADSGSSWSVLDWLIPTASAAETQPGSTGFGDGLRQQGYRVETYIDSEGRRNMRVIGGEVNITGSPVEPAPAETTVPPLLRAVPDGFDPLAAITDMGHQFNAVTGRMENIGTSSGGAGATPSDWSVIASMASGLKIGSRGDRVTALQTALRIPV